MALNNLRKNDIQIVNANAVVRYLLNRCLTYFKSRGKIGHQKMAHLPRERFIEPFSFIYC